MNQVFEVRLSPKAQNNLRKIPKHLVFKLLGWIDAVRRFGLTKVRKSPGYHDEPLKGHRFGQRSIRLNKAYRAIYKEYFDGPVKFILIEEVNKHDY